MMRFQLGDALLRKSILNGIEFSPGTTRFPLLLQKQVGPNVSDRNDRNGLSRKCGNIGALKLNGYFECLPHRA
jgi:hypothetical protein